jgi:hypothetical protein
VRNTNFAVLTTAEDLERYVLGVARGALQSLVIVGRGGTGKSSVVREHLPDGTAAWKSGRVSAVQFYQHLYGNLDRTVVLDDAPNVARDLALAGLLRQLCETRPARTISWDTQNKAIGGEDGIPSSFETTSRFVMITNRWLDRHEEVEALETRCHVVRYEPSVEDLHAKARALPGVDFEVWWYVDEAIAEGRVHTINFRDYITASQKRAIGADWRTALEQCFLPDAVDDLESDEEVLRAVFLKSGKPALSVRDLISGVRRFRGQTEAVERLLKSLVRKGTLVEVRAEPQGGRRGRPQAARYRLAEGTRSRESVRVAV